MLYLTADDLIRLHEAELGTEAIVDFGLLESAVLRPQQTVGGQDAYPELHMKAAAMFHSLVRNHAFVTGNKRTAVQAVAVFYGMNGAWLDAEQGEVVGLEVDVVEGYLDVGEIAKRLARWARPVHDQDEPEGEA